MAGTPGILIGNKFPHQLTICLLVPWAGCWIDYYNLANVLAALQQKIKRKGYNLWLSTQGGDERCVVSHRSFNLKS